MDRCHFLKELSGYVDNQLSEKLKLKIEEHLTTCKICSQELVRLKVLSEKLKNWQAPVLDASFDSSVRNEIVAQELERGEVKMEKYNLRKLIPAATFAMVLIVAIVGWNIYTHHGLQGRLGQRTDQIGSRTQGYETKSFGAGQYEPYYVRNSHHKALDGALEWKSNTKTGGAVDDLGGTQAARRALFQELKRNYSADIVRDDRSKSDQFVNAAQLQSEGFLRPGEGSVIVIQPILPTTAEGEKIIRTGNIRLEVENGQETYKKASQICQELGGYLAASRFYKDNADREAGTITMRIPKDKFATVLDRVSALGKVKNISTDSQDVGQEYANLKSQLDASMIVYDKMLQALQKRQTTIPEAMRLESELTPILRKIEDLKNKIEYLNNAVSFTTITVDFYEAEVSVKALKESGRFIRESLLNAAIGTVRFVASAIPFVILSVSLLVLLIAVVLLVKYWIIRTFKR